MNKERGVEIFNTGVTTVATYLLQGIFGLAITIFVAYVFMPDFFKAAGILLPFGYGQGSGQAMNYGNIYESQYGFEGGKSFGLSVAALGFLSAAIGGVIHLNIIRKKGRMRRVGDEKDFIPSSEVHNEGDIPMNQGIDKITIQIAFIALAYVLSYLLMYGLGLLLPSMKPTIYGFNFFLGVLAAVIVKAIVNLLHKKNVIKKQYTNNFLLTRISNFFFDIMIVAGIAAIKLDTLAQYWHILLVLGVVGLVITYFYNIWVARKLFPPLLRRAVPRHVRHADGHGVDGRHPAARARPRPCDPCGGKPRLSELPRHGVRLPYDAAGDLCARKPRMDAAHHHGLLHRDEHHPLPKSDLPTEKGKRFRSSRPARRINGK